MTEISRSALFGKLNPVGYRALESATVFCKLRGNPYVELVHWLHQLLQLQDSDMHRIIRHFGLDAARLAADITASLDKLPRGATAISDFSPLIEEAVERGWVYGTLLFGENQVRTGHLVVGMLKTKALTNALNGISREFGKLRAEALADEFRKLLDGSPEAARSSARPARPAARSRRRRWASRMR
jgi:type VI secretion system protein VasG